MHVMPESPKAVVEASTVLSSTNANFLSGDTQLLTTTSSTPAGMAPHALKASFRKILNCSPSKVWGRLPTYKRRSFLVAGFEGSCDAGVCSTQRKPSQNLPVFSAGSLPARAASASRAFRAFSSAICLRTAGGGDQLSDRDLLSSSLGGAGSGSRGSGSRGGGRSSRRDRDRGLSVLGSGSRSRGTILSSRAVQAGSSRSRRRRWRSPLDRERYRRSSPLRS
mmetsp:Transcript_12830/g.37447  ORF Transcript_12830/g.37447 Transcript_12830/m.37447 type:complete len:222 (+) Transcript_12830:249-914(+)